MTQSQSPSGPPRLASLPDYLAHHARQTPSREAVRDGAHRISYRELDQRVDDFAGALSRLGIGTGQCLAFQGAPGLAFWVSLLGTQRAGAAWLGLNPAYTPRELAHVLTDATPTVVVSSLPYDATGFKALQEACAAVGRPAPVLFQQAALEQDLTRFEPSAQDTLPTMPRNVALIVYTSGSTGAPKGAMLTSAGLVENGWWLSARMGFAPLRGLVNLPVNHIGCIGDVCATLLVPGGTLVFMERFDAARAVGHLVEDQIEWLPQVPAQFQLMLSRGGLNASALQSVRHLTWGGAAMPASLVQQLKAWVPDLFNSYGLTECSGTITVTSADANVEQLAESVGRPFDKQFLRVADSSGATVQDGEVGEVQIRGPHVFAGYLRRPEASASAFTTDGWLRTGDLGTLGPDGCLRLRGRSHEMFKSGGYNVYPREIETVIETLTGVQLCAVVPVTDPVWGEVGVAFIQGDANRLSLEALKAHCEALLARYKIPKRFVVRGELPLLPIGKVDKAALRQEARLDDEP